MRNKKAYKIIELAYNIATVIYYDHIFDDHKTVMYGGASGGIYDITEFPGTLGQQICKGLHYVGNTLSWDDETPIVEILRKELRRRKRK